MKSYKKQMREIMSIKIDECNEMVNELTQKAREVLNSNYVDWLQIEKMSQQVNIALCECSLLEELVSAKKPKSVSALTMADMMQSRIEDTGHL